MAIFAYQKLIIALIVLYCLSSTAAYSNSHDLRRAFAGMNRVTTSVSPPIANFGSQHTGSSSQEGIILKKSSEPQQTGLAQAAINVDAGLAEQRRFRTTSTPHAAHGILSPEIVARMDENTINRRSNPAVERFLHTYRRKGPMSCLEMLSDPEVLPHLTQAMRDVA